MSSVARIRAKWSGQAGSAAIEYAILASMVAIFIGAIILLGNNVGALYDMLPQKFK